jgi:hypothetical protein
MIKGQEIRYDSNKNCFGLLLRMNLLLGEWRWRVLCEKMKRREFQKSNVPIGMLLHVSPSITYLFRHHYHYVLYENNSKIAQKLMRINIIERPQSQTNIFFVESYNIVATIQTTTCVAYMHWMLLLYFHPTRIKETDKHIT